MKSFIVMTRRRKADIRKICHDSEQKINLLNECVRQTDIFRKEIETFKGKLTEKGKEAQQAHWAAGKSREACEALDQRYEEKLKLSITTRKSIRPLGRLFYGKDTKAKNELADKFYQEAQELKQRIPAGRRPAQSGG